MKNWLVSLVLFAAVPITPRQENQTKNIPEPITGNLFIITTDGFRWQEIFNGADSLLINEEDVTPDTATMKMMFWDPSVTERRKKLMPFFWSILAKKGQVYGNRSFRNKVNVANNYSFSYPGYNEIFTGNTDETVASNSKRANPNINVLEYLNSKEDFHGKVAAFTSWDVFPYILNEERSGIPVNSGYEIAEGALTPTQVMTNKVQDGSINEKAATRFDALTFITAKEYIREHRPRVVYIGLGETDEFAHQGRYDLYLEQANQVDKMIAELWHWVQTTPGYKDNTTFLITTDHGRGKKSGKWNAHSSWIAGSSQTWLAVIGPGIEPLGEMKEDQQLYQEQLAQTIAGLLGEHFETKKRVASAIAFNR